MMMKIMMLTTELQTWSSAYAVHPYMALNCGPPLAVLFITVAMEKRPRTRIPLHTHPDCLRRCNSHTQF